MNDRFLPNLLDEIEQRELALLGWGITSGSFTEDEILALLDELRPGGDADDVLDRLLDHGLVVHLEGQPDRYRTRMAETVRLAVDLRQWFHGQEWRTAKPLVSDVRFLSRARSVPKRNVAPDDLIASLGAASGVDWTPDLERAVRRIVGPRSVSGFQERSAARVLDRAGTGEPLGTCVAAGTGAGKTLAFYLPAIAHLLARGAPGGGARLVALYPRTELLRDQLRGLLITLRGLGDAGAHLRVAVLYGATPKNRRDAKNHPNRRWQAAPDGLECPIISCLADDCDGTYVWRDADGEAEVLTCATCGDVVRSLCFTRDVMYRTPPVALFTSTEMVNRLLGTKQARRLLIGDRQRGPEFILLDEVHTYAGTHGAQVANLLRRWRDELARPAHLVGLSATLADPAGFFAQLTGLATSNVAVVEPRPDEAIPFGREYFLALRGDPASQTALLSTTIQTSMLMRRMLDRERGVPSEGAFGSRLFVFTDKLDVVNRLHDQLSDAEGWESDGVNRKPKASLAVRRAREEPEAQPRDKAGQLWAAAQELGTLFAPVRVTRTTSKDSGVEAGSDIVVATASLEVGFDDPDVGAVIQHKAPRDAAQFLQRRGRAGRNPAMRPWTAVVLSDYGRDRLAFQAYEQLFDPVVAPSHLPIRNRVILKMQATWWLIDHLGRHTDSLSARTVIERGWTMNADGQERYAEKLLEVLQGLLTEAGMNRLSTNLRWALGLDDEDVRSILWDHPRALMTSVIPALIRRTEAIVDRAAVPAGYSWTDPLDDFVPRSLFASLQTPEVRFRLPFGRQDDGEVESISLSMREFAPGRVSYRFALKGKRERLWVAPPPPDQPDLAVESFCSEHMPIEPPPGAGAMPIVQPRTIELAKPAGSVKDAAYGTWLWQSEFRYDGVPLDVDMPAGSGWPVLVRSFKALTHRGRCSTTVWRYATECEVEPRSKTGPALVRHRVTLGGAPAAVGFVMDVDALQLTIDLPDVLALLTADGVLRATRVARLEHVIGTSPRLIARAPSPFLRSWLAQLLVSAVVSEAGDADLDALLASTSEADLRAAMLDIAGALFDASPPGDQERADGSSAEPALLLEVQAILAHDDVVTELRDLAACLLEAPDRTWVPWLRERLATTIAAAVIEAIGATCPDLDVDDLRPDVELAEDADGAPIARIWISEDQPGGTGVVESAIDRYVADPRAFWALASRSVGPCDAERVDQNLRAFLAERARGELDNEVLHVRVATELSKLTDAWSALRAALFRKGLDSDQTVVAALATRLLRAGSDRRTEELLGLLLDRWAELEGRLGIEVDVRTFASLVASDPDIRRRVRDVSGAEMESPARRIGQILSLLWARGAVPRAASLQSWNPYREQLPTERLLVAAVVDVPSAVARYGSLDWRGVLDGALHRDGRAVIRAADDAEASFAVCEVLTRPTAVGVLEFHPRVVGLVRTSTHVDVQVEIREAHQ